MEEAVYVESTQNRNLVIYLQYIEKESIVNACATYCDSKHSNILRESSRFHCCLVLNGCGQKWAQPFKFVFPDDFNKDLIKYGNIVSCLMPYSKNIWNDHKPKCLSCIFDELVIFKFLSFLMNGYHTPQFKNIAYKWF